jgi:hypothetical protein
VTPKASRGEPTPAGDIGPPASGTMAIPASSPGGRRHGRHQRSGAVITTDAPGSHTPAEISACRHLDQSRVRALRHAEGAASQDYIN